MLNYSAIPVIVVLCYLAITAIKSTKVDSKWYPLISCTIGAILGAALFYVFPEFIGTASLMAAIISGGVSGLAATGTNQVFKQLMKAAENGEDLSKVDLKGNATTITTTNDAAPSGPSPEATNVNKTNDTGGSTDNK